MLALSAYETLSVLGSGQFGNVVLVRRNSDRKLFAAKVPHGEDTAARLAARQEAQLLMQLHHANIVQFIEVVEEDSQIALVMEYTSGGDLDTFLRWQQESTGFLSEPAIMRIFIQVVLALQHLHEHRILHRDLKPKNILLDGDGIVKLSDFGVSTVLQSSVDSAQTITGTPHYMSPEILDGDSYDCKSDVWSLGCVLYELATFSPPFTGSALGAVVGQILNCDPPPIPLCYTPPFRALASKLLEKDPRRRPGLPEILTCQAVQHSMMQLVSVATSHQPMLLEQFAAKKKDCKASQQDEITLSEVVTPLPSRQGLGSAHQNSDQAKGFIRKIQPETNDARQVFFENQAAARKNKERIVQERSCPAVFLDCNDCNSPDHHTQVQAQIQKPSLINSPSGRQILESFGCSVAVSKPDMPPAPSSLASVRGRAQSSPSNYEDLLNNERRRVQLETKALQERMRVMQATD